MIIEFFFCLEHIFSPRGYASHITTVIAQATQNKTEFVFLDRHHLHLPKSKFGKIGCFGLIPTWFRGTDLNWNRNNLQIVIVINYINSDLLLPKTAWPTQNKLFNKQTWGKSKRLFIKLVLARINNLCQ